MAPIFLTFYIFYCDIIQWFEEKLLETNIKFRDILKEKSEQSIEKLDRLDDRITALGQHFEKEKATILEQIKERGEELAMMLYKFKVSLLALFIYSCFVFRLSHDICGNMVLKIFHNERRRNLIVIGNYD